MLEDGRYAKTHYLLDSKVSCKANYEKLYVAAIKSSNGPL